MKDVAARETELVLKVHGGEHVGLANHAGLEAGCVGFHIVEDETSIAILGSSVPSCGIITI